MICNSCQRNIADGSKFCYNCGARQMVTGAPDAASVTGGPKRLMRSSTDKKLGGVCGGLAEYFDMDPTLVRVLWLLVVLCGARQIVPGAPDAASVTGGPEKLIGSSRGKNLGGVCGGLAEYFDMDPTLVRVLWLLVVLCGGTGILLYVILWLVLPLAPPLVAVTPPAGPLATQTGG